MVRTPYHLGAAVALCLLSLPLFRLAFLASSQPHGVLRYIELIGLAGVVSIILLCVYRLALHPLAKYPGPFLGAITNWYTIYWILNGKRHLDLYRQHQRHGKYVRYSPSRLSINSAEASEDLHNVKANTVKADFYTAAKVIFGADMSQTTVDHKKHAFRRRVNVTALTPAAVKEYGSQVSPHVDYFIELMSAGIVGEDWGPPQDVSKSVAYCIADIMGALTFGKTWNVQREDTYRKIIEEGPLGVAGLHLIGHRQATLRFNLHKILFKELIDGVQQLTGVAESWAQWRESQKSLPHRDIWAALLEARDPDTGAPFSREELVSEATLFITGGTDTAITALCGTLFYLTQNPHALERLTKEIRDAFPLSDGSQPGFNVDCPIQFASKELQGISYIFACIDEAMRLTPSVLSILPRTVARGGIIIDGEFFPEGVTLGTPHYVMHRDPENFPEPDRYVPERWIPEERTKGRADGSVPSTGHESASMRAGAGIARGYTPFGAGRGSCIGKHLAYQEMTYMLARLVWLFDMRIAAGSEAAGEVDKDYRVGEFQTLDRFVSSQEGPSIQFRYREELR